MGWRFEHVKHITMHVGQRRISSYSEANASWTDVSADVFIKNYAGIINYLRLCMKYFQNSNHITNE